MLKLAIKTFAAILGVLPLRVSLALGRGLGWIFHRILRFRRAETLARIQRSLELPETECRQILAQMYGHLGMNLVETMLLIAGKEQVLFDRITLVGEEHLKSALDRGNGVLLLTGHCGSWELLATWGGASGVLPRVTVLVKEIRNVQLNELVLETRSRLIPDVRFVHQSIRAMRNAMRALASNEAVSFLVDQNTIYREGVFVRLFGRLCCTRDGLAKLAARQQSPILPVFIRRTADHRHEITMHEPLDPPALQDRHSILEATQHYTKVTEDHIRRHPAQWLWIHRRWKTTIQDIPPERLGDYILPEDALAEVADRR